MLVELLGLFDGRIAGVQKLAAELSAHSHGPSLWQQGWGGRGAPSAATQELWAHLL